MMKSMNRYVKSNMDGRKGRIIGKGYIKNDRCNGAKLCTVYEDTKYPDCCYAMWGRQINGVWTSKSNIEFVQEGHYGKKEETIRKI